MVRGFLIVGLLVVGVAQAQTITLTATGATTDTIRFNASGCNNDLQITWTSTLLIAPSGPLQLWSTEGECGDAALASDVRYTDVPQATVYSARTGNFVIHLSELPAFKYSDAGVVCGAALVEKPQKICGSFTSSGAYVGAATTIEHATALNVIYDTLPPDVPSIDAVSEQDTALKLTFTVASDVLTIHFDAKAPTETDFTERASVDVSTGNLATIDHLVNGTTYDLRARAEDAAGNISDPSEIVSATPRHTAGFWTQYRRDGGDEQGGCTAIHGLPIALATGLWLMRRKRM